MRTRQYQKVARVANSGTVRWCIQFIRRTGLAVTILVAVFAVIYSLEGLVRHWNFGSSFDLAIYDQAVWHFSRLEIPTSSIRGYPNIFGDHFHPVLMLFAPLYWLRSSAATLLVAQGVLFALSIVPVFLYARGRLGDNPALLLARGRTGLFWGLQQAAAFDVHEFAFAPLFIATAVLAMERRNWPLFWGMMVCLGLTKEDLLPLVAWFGAYIWWKGRSWRGGILAVAGLVAFALVVGVVIPWMGGVAGFGYSGAYAEALRRPWTIPMQLVDAAHEAVHAADVVRAVRVPAAGVAARAPARCPLASRAVPVVGHPHHWGMAFHYSAPVAPILAMAAADGLARISADRRCAPSRRFVAARRGRRGVPRPGRLAAGTPAALAGVLSGFLRAPQRRRPARQRALRLVPPEASVVAHAAVLPHLSQRERAYVLQARGAGSGHRHRGLGAQPVAHVERFGAQRAPRRAAGARAIACSSSRTGGRCWHANGPSDEQPLDDVPVAARHEVADRLPEVVPPDRVGEDRRRRQHRAASGDAARAAGRPCRW